MDGQSAPFRAGRDNDLTLLARMRLAIVTLVVVGLLGCGGHEDNGPDPTPALNSGMKLQGIDFNCSDFLPWQSAIAGCRTAPSTTQVTMPMAIGPSKRLLTLASSA